MKQRENVVINESVLNKEQVAGSLGVTTRTVEELLRTGKLKGHKVGKIWCVLHSDLIAYVKSH